MKRSVLIIGSEAVPFAKTGGLADVLGALPHALARLGWDVTLALPMYRGVTGGTAVDGFPVTVGAYSRDVRFFEAPLAEGARAILVDCPDLYDRNGIYGEGGIDYADSPRRFAVLARAALEFTAKRGGSSVVHAHDWQGGLAPVYLKTIYASHPTLGGTPSIFTIHNLAYQGAYDADWLPRLDLGWELLNVDRMEFWGRINLLKAGINEADVVTTVSQRYAEEIQTPEFGWGLDGVLRQRRDCLVGVQNGIDTAEWDPAHDRYLPKPYDATDLSGKAAAKAALLTQYKLPSDAAAMKRPVVGMISRLVDQKGFDLIAALGEELLALDAAFVVLGTGEARYQDFWMALATAHPDRVGAHIGFSEMLAHLIEGGADIFLMPSRFEPSGLNQMYSLRYGTVPVVRAVGGLADTVIDYKPPAPKRGGGPAAPTRSEGGTGFVFQDYTPAALLGALRRALAAYDEPGEWRALQLAGLIQDFSWDRSAREYVKLYERVLLTRPRTKSPEPGTRN
jgi:starch synthase